MTQNSCAVGMRNAKLGNHLKRAVVGKPHDNARKGHKGLIKLGNTVRKHCCGGKCFPVKRRGEHVAEANFAARKQKTFLPWVKNIFVSRTNVLLPKHMFPRICKESSPDFGSHFVIMCMRDLYLPIQCVLI